MAALQSSGRRQRRNRGAAASLADANEISMDLAVAAVLSEPDGIFK